MITNFKDFFFLKSGRCRSITYFGDFATPLIPSQVCWCKYFSLVASPPRIWRSDLFVSSTRLAASARDGLIWMSRSVTSAGVKLGTKNFGIRQSPVGDYPFPINAANTSSNFHLILICSASYTRTCSTKTRSSSFVRVLASLY